MTKVLPRRFRRNLTSNYAWTASSMAVALVMTPVLVHGLGKEAYGIWVLVGSMIFYLELLEFGFGPATAKYVAEFESRGDRELVRRTIATSFWVLALPGLLAMVVGVVFAALFPIIFDVPRTLERGAQVLVILVALDLALSIPWDSFGTTLIGLQRYDLLNATLVLVLLAQAAGWALVLWAGGGLVALGLVTVGPSLAGQLARSLIVRRLVPGAAVSPELFDRSLVRPLASFSVWMLLARVARVVTVRIDPLIVGLVVGVPEAGLYAVGQRLAFLAENLVTPITQLFFPHASHLAARSDASALRTAVSIGTRITLGVAGPVCIAAAVLAEPGLQAWVGSGFEEARLVVVFLAGAVAIKALTRTGVFMLQGTGMARVPATISAGEAAFNLTLSIVLGRLIGLEGVALATLLASAVADLVFLLPYICRQFGTSVASLLASVLRAHVPAAASGLAVGVLMLRLGVSGIPGVVGAALLVIAAYSLVFAVTGLSRDERRRIAAVARARLSGSVPAPAAPETIPERIAE